jgi:cytochrome b subunit of formate dehydrogenase
MRETLNWLSILVTVFLLIAAGVLLATTPFALIGWILLSFANIIGAGLVTSYLNCFVTGAAVGIIAGLLAK